MSKKIINFHLPADDVDRAAKFYRVVFGWEFVAFPDSPVPYLVHEAGEDGAGIPAAITARQAVINSPVPTIEVDHIDQTLIEIATNGGQQGRVQDLPGIGRFAYAIDSEGNTIAVLQRPEPAQPA